MNDLVRDLPAQARVLDLGAGGGSFDYSSTAARVTAVDLAFPSGPVFEADRLYSDSGRLALAADSMDVVVCNHTWEHFESLGDAVAEIVRVLRPGGFLWVAVPDGYSFDDGLYRYLFQGGGHVNRFSLQSLIDTAEREGPLRARRGKILYTGFVYLNPPDPAKLVHYRGPSRHLGRVPPKFLEHGIRMLNLISRWTDRILGSSLSRYGWGVVFEKAGVDGPETRAEDLELSRSDLNVCFSCGAGHPRDLLREGAERFLFLKVYRCRNCGRQNPFFSWKTS